MNFKLRPRCYFDIHIGHSPAGRIVFELYNDLCPIAVDKFIKLCTAGECGHGKKTYKKLYYSNTIFHRVVKGFMIEGGVFCNDGTCVETAYEDGFADENVETPYDRPFLLSMTNTGSNTNGSQFFITTNCAPQLNKKHAVFGHVIAGEQLVHSIENLPVTSSKKPVVEATIVKCGKLIAVRKSTLVKARRRAVDFETKKSNSNNNSKSKELDESIIQKGGHSSPVDYDTRFDYKSIKDSFGKIIKDNYKFRNRSRLSKKNLSEINIQLNESNEYNQKFNEANYKKSSTYNSIEKNDKICDNIFTKKVQEETQYKRVRNNENNKLSIVDDEKKGNEPSIHNRRRKYEKSNQFDDSTTKRRRRRSVSNKHYCDADSSFNQLQLYNNKNRIKNDKKNYHEISQTFVVQNHPTMHQINNFDDTVGDIKLGHLKKKNNDTIFVSSDYNVPPKVSLYPKDNVHVISNKKIPIKSSEFNQHEKIVFDTHDSFPITKINRKRESIDAMPASENICLKVESIQKMQLNSVLKIEIDTKLQSNNCDSMKCSEDFFQWRNISEVGMFHSNVKRQWTPCGSDQRDDKSVGFSSKFTDVKNLIPEYSARSTISKLKIENIQQHQTPSPNKVNCTTCTILPKKRCESVSLSSGTVDSSSSSDGSSASNRPRRIDSDLSDREKNDNTQSWVDDSNLQELKNIKLELFKVRETLFKSEPETQMAMNSNSVPHRESKGNVIFCELFDSSNNNLLTNYILSETAKKDFDQRSYNDYPKLDYHPNIVNDNGDTECSATSPISRSISKYRHPSDSSSDSSSSSFSRSERDRRLHSSHSRSHSVVKRYRCSQFYHR